jgi:hypothetical protein
MSRKAGDFKLLQVTISAMPNSFTKRLATLLVGLVFATALFIARAPLGYAAYVPLLGARSDKISDSAAGATATHAFGFSYLQTGTPLGSVKFQFCSNSPLPEDACVAPLGLDASARVLASQSGQATGFTIHPNSDANTIIITRVPSLPSLGTSAYIFDNIINPSLPGSYYVRLTTYPTTDATGAPTEEGGTVFAILSGLSISTEVPPYLRFCAAVTITAFDCSTATSFFIDMGELKPNQTTKASSQFVAATNAVSGYTVTINGITLTSGTNTIPPLAVPTSPIAGTSQFGINLRGNSNPAVGSDVVGPGTANATANYNTPNLYQYQNGDTVVTVNHSNDNRKFTVSYMTNINASQPAGFYVTTMTFICLANF